MQPFLDHIALNVNDPEGMTAFYSQVLGLAPERLEAFAQGQVPFPSVRINENAIIDFFPPDMWKDELPGGLRQGRMNHFCLTIGAGDWEGFLERLDRLGVVIVVGPAKRWGAHGDAVAVYFHDPEGNLIEVRHYPGEG